MSSGSSVTMIGFQIRQQPTIIVLCDFSPEVKQTSYEAFLTNNFFELLGHTLQHFCAACRLGMLVASPLPIDFSFPLLLSIPSIPSPPANYVTSRTKPCLLYSSTDNTRNKSITTCTIFSMLTLTSSHTSSHPNPLLSSILSSLATHSEQWNFHRVSTTLPNASWQSAIFDIRVRNPANIFSCCVKSLLSASWISSAYRWNEYDDVPRNHNTSRSHLDRFATVNVAPTPL